jgi:hypothetical protein
VYYDDDDDDDDDANVSGVANVCIINIDVSV